MAFSSTVWATVLRERFCAKIDVSPVDGDGAIGPAVTMTGPALSVLSARSKRSHRGSVGLTNGAGEETTKLTGTEGFGAIDRAPDGERLALPSEHVFGDIGRGKFHWSPDSSLLPFASLESDEA